MLSLQHDQSELGFLGHCAVLGQLLSSMMPSPPDPQHPSTALYNDGLLNLEQGRLELALDCFVRSWALAEHAMTAYRLGHVLKGLGRSSDSSDWFARAYRLHSRNAMIATGYARSLLEQHQAEDAVVVLNELLTHMPDYGPARALLSALRP